MSTILLDSVITGSKITARYCDSLQVGDDAWVAGPGYCIVTHVLKVYFMQRFRVKALPCFLSHPYNLLIPPITSTSTNQVVLLSKWGWLFQRTEEKLLPSCSSSHTLYDPSCVNCLFIFNLTTPWTSRLLVWRCISITGLVACCSQGKMW